MLESDHSLIEQLLAKGVRIHAPAATVVAGVDPERVEPGVEVFPATTLVGAKTLLRSGTKLGKAGGGYFEDVCTGRNVDLFGGYFQDAVFLDGVKLRGHAEVRGGTLLEEGVEAAHHVGYKMTVMLPYVVAGSLVNFCDVLMAGGTSRKDHSEIGSTLALYNFTPWGDKFASLFGDVPSGVFLRSRRIFVGGQTQIVSPVKVGYGSVIAAGCAVRRSVPEGMLYGEPASGLELPFDSDLYGGLMPKFRLTAEYVANLWCLLHWYQDVRRPLDRDDATQQQLYDAAERQIRAGIGERVKRLAKLVARLPGSLAGHRAALDEADATSLSAATHRKRIAEHERLLDVWPRLQVRLETGPDVESAEVLAELVDLLHTQRGNDAGGRYVELIRGDLPEDLIGRCVHHLQDLVDAVIDGLEL